MYTDNPSTAHACVSGLTLYPNPSFWLSFKYWIAFWIVDEYLFFPAILNASIPHPVTSHVDNLLSVSITHDEFGSSGFSCFQPKFQKPPSGLISFRWWNCF